MDWSCPSENVIGHLTIAFVGGLIGAWFRIVRFVVLAGLVLLLGFAGFTLISIVAPDVLGMQPRRGPQEGLGAGAAILMVFVLPALLVGLLFFGAGWGVGRIARQATAPRPEDPHVVAERKAAKAMAAMDEIRRISGGAGSDPTSGSDQRGDRSP